MKKIILTMLILIALFVQPVFAAELPSRYLWLDSSDNVNYYIDTETVKFQRSFDGQIDTNAVDVWLLYTFSDEARDKKVDRLINKYGVSFERANEFAYQKYNFIFRLKRQEFYCKSILSEDSEGETIKKFVTKKEFISVVPDSIFEKVVRKINEYVKLHQGEIMERA